MPAAKKRHAKKRGSALALDDSRSQNSAMLLFTSEGPRSVDRGLPKRR